MENILNEPTTIGLSDLSHKNLQLLKEEKVFREMADGYRFAVALALSKNITPNEVKNRQTIFNVGTLDPDKGLYTAVSSLYTDIELPVYRIVERLAEWGINHLMNIYNTKGEIVFSEFFED